MAEELIHDRTAGIERLLEIMRRLRDPETGCPWDIEQNFDTIAPYTIEEAYEVADAIERSDWSELTGASPSSRILQWVIDVSGELASLQINTHLMESSPESGPLIELEKGRTVR